MTGCDSAGSGGGGATPNSTVEWEVDRDGYFQYLTNDPQAYNTGTGRTYFTSKEVPWSVSEVWIKKMSGSKAGSFGMVFNDDFISGNSHEIQIKLTGHYQIGEWENDILMPITDWIQSDAINTGYNQINIIRAEISGFDCIVTINETPVHTITGFTPSVGSNLGPVVWVASEIDENFPEEPVDIRAKITQPIVRP